MRAAAVAFVLIVGAAIVLWFGNSSNSLVLGGLIGGLAALLLSIPISVMLFSYLSHRHDEQLRVEAQEDMSLAQSQSFEDEYADTAEEVYEAEPYMLPPAQELNDRRAPAGERYLPVPSRSRLPVSPARQYQLPALSSENLAYRQRTPAYPPASERQPVQAVQPAQVGRNNHAPTPVRRPQPVQADRQNRYPGFPGYQTGSMRSYHQSSALRVAQQEAAQQRRNEKDTEVFPTGTSKRLPAVRTDMSMVKQPYRPNGVRPASRLIPQAPNQYRPKRTVEGSSSVPPGLGSGSNRALPRVGESSSYQNTEGLSSRGHEGRDRQTDYIGDRYPQTGQFRQPPTRPQTGQMGRNPQVEAQPRDPDIITGSLKNPLVRRAPYMYEDDPLRQELAQHLDASPVRRRSSRYLNEEE
ncbi:MAG: hypothetical protein NVSMB27_40680 [Ktedonobacteraceae bacterium]